MELLRGSLLFKTHDELEHIALIERIVGSIPEKMRKNRDFFDSHKDLRWPPSRKSRSYDPDAVKYVKKRRNLLDTVIHQVAKYDEANVNLLDRFIEFVHACLTVDPNERMTAKAALDSPFLAYRPDQATPDSSKSQSPASSAEKNSSSFSSSSSSSYHRRKAPSTSPF